MKSMDIISPPLSFLYIIWSENDMYSESVKKKIKLPSFISPENRSAKRFYYCIKVCFCKCNIDTKY